MLSTITTITPKWEILEKCFYTNVGFGISHLKIERLVKIDTIFKFIGKDYDRNTRLKE